MKLRDTFNAVYEQYSEHDEKEFVLLEIIDSPDENHDEEILPMYKIQLSTGEIIEAWPEEIGI